MHLKRNAHTDFPGKCRRVEIIFLFFGSPHKSLNGAEEQFSKQYGGFTIHMTKFLANKLLHKSLQVYVWNQNTPLHILNTTIKQNRRCQEKKTKSNQTKQKKILFKMPFNKTGEIIPLWIQWSNSFSNCLCLQTHSCSILYYIRYKTVE